MYGFTEPPRLWTISCLTDVNDIHCFGVHGIEGIDGTLEMTLNVGNGCKYRKVEKP
jgi:hypothetical protein